MISKLMLLEQLTIQEKKQQLLNKGISNDIIDKLLQCDPTNKNKSDTDKVGSYTDWIFNTYITTNIFPNVEELKHSLILYHKYKHKINDITKRHINNFKSFEDFITFIKSQQFQLGTDNFKIIVEEEYDITYSKNYIIHIPHTQNQATELGKGTKWCTTSENGGNFRDYQEQGIIFYITNKSTNAERFNLFLKYQSEYFEDYDEDYNNLEAEYDIFEFADQQNNHNNVLLYDFIIEKDKTILNTIKNYLKYCNKFDKMNYDIQNLLNQTTKEQLNKQYQDIQRSEVFRVKNISNELIKQLLEIDGDQLLLLKSSNIKITDELVKAQLSNSGTQLRYLLEIKYPLTNEMISIQLTNVKRQDTILMSFNFPLSDQIVKQQIARNPNIISHILRHNVIVNDNVKQQYLNITKNYDIFNYDIIEFNSGYIQRPKSKEQYDAFLKYYSSSIPTTIYNNENIIPFYILRTTLKIDNQIIYGEHPAKNIYIFLNISDSILPLISTGSLRFGQTNFTIYDLVKGSPNEQFDILHKIKSYLEQENIIHKLSKHIINLLSQTTIKEVAKALPPVQPKALELMSAKILDDNIIVEYLKYSPKQLIYLMLNPHYKYSMTPPDKQILEKYLKIVAENHDSGINYILEILPINKIPTSVQIQQVRKNPNNIKILEEKNSPVLDKVINQVKNSSSLNESIKYNIKQYNIAKTIIEEVDKYV